MQRRSDRSIGVEVCRDDDVIFYGNDIYQVDIESDPEHYLRSITPPVRIFTRYAQTLARYGAVNKEVPVRNVDVTQARQLPPKIYRSHEPIAQRDVDDDEQIDCDTISSLSPMAPVKRKLINKQRKSTGLSMSAGQLQIAPKSRKLKPGETMPKLDSVKLATGRQLMAANKESVILKMLIIGDPCVGKTSLVQRFVNGTFHRNYKGTIGVDFALKIMRWEDSSTVKIQLWDIAGQERYTSMTRVYYRDAHGCLVMFDLTNRNSFLNVAKWKRDFDAKCVPHDGVPIPCLLIANKADSNGLRQVTDDEIERMCTEFNFNAWTEMSVKDNFMVDDAMSYLLSCIFNQPMPIATSMRHNNSVVKLTHADLTTSPNRSRCVAC